MLNLENSSVALESLKTTPSLSVLICAYNEERLIPNALQSLQKQTVPLDSFEVIVVDNASTDSTKAAVEANQGALNLTYVFEPHLNLNVACNTGYRHTHADYVANLDADTMADPDWVKNILTCIRQHSPILCGGPYFPYYIEKPPVWYLDEYNCSDKGVLPRYLSEKDFLSGANMIWKKKYVMEMGGFDEHLGLEGRGLVRGSETSLMQKAKKSDPSFRMYYDPSIKVLHYTRPITYSIWYWMKRSFAFYYSAEQFYPPWIYSQETLPLLDQLFKLVRQTVWEGTAALWKRDTGQFPYWENYFMSVMRGRISKIGQFLGILIKRKP